MEPRTHCKEVLRVSTMSNEKQYRMKIEKERERERERDRHPVYAENVSGAARVIICKGDNGRELTEWMI